MLAASDSGYLEIVKWLWNQHAKLPEHASPQLVNKEYKFIRYWLHESSQRSCVKGHLDVAQWFFDSLPEHLSIHVVA